MDLFAHEREKERQREERKSSSDEGQANSTRSTEPVGAQSHDPEIIV